MQAITILLISTFNFYNKINYLLSKIIIKRMKDGTSPKNASFNKEKEGLWAF